MTNHKTWLVGNGLVRKGRARAIAAIFACGVLAACGMTPEQEAAAIEQGIIETPGSEELWAAIKQEYPGDLEILVRRLQSAEPSGGNAEELSNEIAADWMRVFFARIGADAVKAPEEQLIAWSAAEAALYASLQDTAVGECAAMTMGQWIFIDESNTAAAAIARRNAAMVRAAAAGRDNPQTYAEPQEAALVELGDAIAATGIAPELQASLASAAAMAALSPAQQCEIGVAVHAGISALPDDKELPVAAYMLSPE